MIANRDLVGWFADPPEGWRWGFPKQYNPKESEALEDWLIRNGYPRRLATFGAKHCRFIEMTPPPSLVDGNIPAHTVCPYRKVCEIATANACYHKGLAHAVAFSCASARGFEILNRK